MRTEDIHNLLITKFEEEGFRECFVVGIEQKGKSIKVFLDSDTGITLENCRSISRYLEGIFDEKLWFGTDYVLEVSSAGLSRPLVFARQYIKNIGRDMEIILLDGLKIEGTLIEADQNIAKISYTETRKENKKKITETIIKEIPYSNIKVAKIMAKI